MTTTKVIGIGNSFRRDDSVGLTAARRLREIGVEGILVEEASGEGADLIDRWEGFARVILVDAVRSGAEPGTIHVLEASAQSIPTKFFSYSTHAFSVAEAVELARQLGSLPEQVVIFGIEGEEFSTGEGLTTRVEQAVDEVVRHVQALLLTSFARP